jgi:hypothetical protein
MRFVEPAIRGKGFYPGCSGFDADPTGGIMLLGRDFGTRTYFEGLAGPPVRDEAALTWRHTRDIWLKELGDISAWCTNYLMGLREDGSAKGNIKLRIAATDWNLFESSCWDFLQGQVLLQKTSCYRRFRHRQPTRFDGERPLWNKFVEKLPSCF